MLLLAPALLLIVNWGAFVLSMLAFPFLTFYFRTQFKKEPFVFYQNASIKPTSLLMVSLLVNIVFVFLAFVAQWMY